MIPTSAPLTLVAAFAMLAVASTGRAQCDLAALPGDVLAQLQGNVDCLTQWDPDGAGPLPLQLVAGGTFDVANVHDEHVVLWNGTSWTTTSAGFGGVTAMTVWNGLLVAAAAEAVWTFNGTAWSVLASVEYGSPTAPLPGVVNTINVYNGQLVVAGRFARIVAPFLPATDANAVATWNGSTWAALGSGPAAPAGTPVALCSAIFTGSLWIGGSFPDGTARLPNLQVWNGTAWSAVSQWDAPIDTLSVRVGTALTNSFLFAGGRFSNLWQTPSSTTPLSTPYVARYSPSTLTWSAIGAPPLANGTTGCQQLFVRGTGLTSYEVGATFTSNGYDLAWRLAGTTWNPLPNITGESSPLTAVRLHYFGGRYVGGLHGVAPAFRGLRFHNTTNSEWLPLVGQGFDERVLAVCRDGAELVVGGWFAAISGTPMNYIARGHAGAWQPMGSGFGSSVRAIARMANGDIVAGGDFTTLGDLTPMARIARWNGTAWSSIGGGMNGSVLALLPLPNGELIAAGGFTTAGGSSASRIARWTGSAWVPLGTGTNGAVNTLLRRANGDVVAGGSFTVAGSVVTNRVALWNGAAWSPMGLGFDGNVYALTESNDGLVAAGEFQNVLLGTGTIVSPNLARWVGNGWTSFAPVAQLPDHDIRALATLPGGETAIGGTEFTIAGTTTCAAVWRGSSWQSLDVRGTSVLALATGTDGRLAVGGRFVRVGNTISANVATVVSSCAATTASIAPGCPSSGGSNTLTAVTLPWANGAFRTQATGLPATALALVLTSVTPVLPPVPLPQLVAQGVPGCNLHVAPDILQLAIAAGGTAQSELLLPSGPSIVGATFYQQMVPIEFDPLTGGWLAITATNALQLVAGYF